MSEPTLLETDVRAMVRLLCRVADATGERIARKRLLMQGMAELIRADRWSWIVARADSRHHNPGVVEFLHEGFTDEEYGHYVAMMQDRRHPPVEYAALNGLRRVSRRFTRSWEQLVPAELWYGQVNRRRLEAIGFEHIMYSVHLLDDEGLFSGLAWMRKAGQPNFSPRDRRIAHIITSEVPWLHHDAALAQRGDAIAPLSPRLRTVLTLMVDGRTIKQIAQALGLSPQTVADYTKLIHKRFGVRSRAQLLRYFMCGDGADLLPESPGLDQPPQAPR